MCFLKTRIINIYLNYNNLLFFKINNKLYINIYVKDSNYVEICFGITNDII
jgi:hypothetical protein